MPLSHPCLTDLLRRHVEGDGPEVDASVGVDAGDDGEDAGPLGPALAESPEAEDDGTLVLRHHLDDQAEGEGHGDDDEHHGEEGQHHGGQTGTFGIG